MSTSWHCSQLHFCWSFLAQENEEDNQNDDLNGNNASNGHDLDEAEEGVKNAAKKVLDALNNRENDNTGDEEVKRDSIEEVSKAEKEKTPDQATPAEDKTEDLTDLPSNTVVEVEEAEVPANVEEQEVSKPMEPPFVSMVAHMVHPSIEVHNDIVNYNEDMAKQQVLKEKIAAEEETSTQEIKEDNGSVVVGSGEGTVELQEEGNSEIESQEPEGKEVVVSEVQDGKKSGEEVSKEKVDKVEVCKTQTEEEETPNKEETAIQKAEEVSQEKAEDEEAARIKAEEEEATKKKAQEEAS